MRHYHAASPATQLSDLDTIDTDASDHFLAALNFQLDDVFAW